MLILIIVVFICFKLRKRKRVEIDNNPSYLLYKARDTGGSTINSKQLVVLTVVVTSCKDCVDNKPPEVKTKTRSTSFTRLVHY